MRNLLLKLFRTTCGAWGLITLIGLSAQADPVTVDGVVFSNGYPSFADRVDLVDPLASGGPTPAIVQSMDLVLGTPDGSYASLGNGGLIQMSFLDNWLTNSGDAATDLFLAEASGTPEAVITWLHATPETAALLPAAADPEVDGFFTFGTFKATRSGSNHWFGDFDIDSVFPGFAAGALKFDGVQIMDDPSEGSTTGSSVGMDLDAVGAITSTARDYLIGDFNADGVYTMADFDLLARYRGSYLSFYDVNADQRITVGDVEHWIKEIHKAYLGDANLDGEFNSNDLVQVFVAGKYEDAVGRNTSWTEGDWDFDRDFTTNDLVAAFQEGAYEQGPRPAAVSTPEPTTGALTAIGALVLLKRKPRHLTTIDDRRSA